MFNYIFYRIGKFIALAMPLKLGYALAIFVSDIKYMFSFSERRQIQGNLKVIFPKKSVSEIRIISRQMFRNFGKYLVDFFRFSKLDHEYIKKNIKIENLHYFKEALKKKKGVVVLTAHLGNWELGGVVIALSGFSFWVVALPHKNKKVNDFFNHQRESKGIQVIAVGQAARQCLKLLKENHLVALVGDRDFGQKGIAVDFFGKPTNFPLGPAAFALNTGSVIVPGFMLRNPDDTFTLRIEKPIEVEKYGSSFNKEDKDKYLVEIIKRYTVIIEEYVRKYPDQWYVFRRFWIG